MIDAALILIEGMTGAGKSTTAKGLADALQDRGFSARWYHEFDGDNPIRSKSADAMKASQHGEPPPEIAGYDEQGRNPYGAWQWSDYATRLRSEKKIGIVESRYWQNLLFARYMAGWEVDALLSYQARQFDAMLLARPFLVYLSNSDVAASIDRILANRDSDWAEWVQQQFQESIPAKRLGLIGRDAMVGVYREWNAIADRLFDAHAEWKLKLIDPYLDWGAAIAELHRTLEI